MANRLAARRAEIDHHQKERRQHVEAEMRPEPGQAERQHDLGRRRRAEQVGEPARKRHQGGHEAQPVHDRAGRGPPADGDARGRRCR